MLYPCTYGALNAATRAIDEARDQLNSEPYRTVIQYTPYVGMGWKDASGDIRPEIGFLGTLNSDGEVMEDPGGDPWIYAPWATAVFFHITHASNPAVEAGLTTSWRAGNTASEQRATYAAFDNEVKKLPVQSWFIEVDGGRRRRFLINPLKTMTRGNYEPLAAKAKQRKGAPDEDF